VKLGRYEIVRELGKGAMGVVYLAKDPLIGRLVALKTIRAAAHSDDEETKEFQQRFIREAQAAGILNHPAIVTVHDIGQDESTGTSFIAMEYVEGHNLKELLAHGNPLPWEQVVDIISQIGDALDFAHAKGIVHRDVKPANIILIEGGRAKITDFGIAKIASGVANLTTTGQFLGTPNYMAPEQIKGTPVDGRTDLFSLGICLYECLTRRKPFGGDSLTSISYKIVHESFPPLREINPEIPEAFEEIVARCLSKEPAKRYQRGRDVAAALRTALRGDQSQQHEPALHEETMITRDRAPTVEVPLPDGFEDSGAEIDAAALAVGAAGASHRAVTEPVPVSNAAPRARPSRGPDFSRLVRNTVTNMRAYPVWQRRIPPAIFLAVVIVLISGFVGAVASVRSKQVAVPTVDRSAEMRHERERKLRTEANDLLHQGNVSGAYAKYIELQKMAPNSPAINTLVQKLSATLQASESSKKQLEVAKQKYQEGVAAYNQKNYEQAIELLQQSFSLNPEPEATKAYLQLAQQQLVMQQQLTEVKKLNQPATRNPAVVVTQTQPPVPVGGSPASLNTVFNSPFSDGYIMVKAGGDIVAHENLWEEKGRFFRRQYPRPINVTKQFPAKVADVEVWVVVPSQKIQEHTVMRQAFSPGTQHKLLVAFDQASKRFTYQLN
jgi:serine/threonine protein kinase